MHFGYTTYRIKLYSIKSLKEKRSIVKRLINDLRKNFNASVVETGAHDSKTWLEVSVGMITLTKKEMDALFESVESRIVDWNGLEVVDVESEIW